jgi:rubrerythrin
LSDSTRIDMASENGNGQFGGETSCEGLGALRTALQAEKEGVRMYLEWARRTSDPTGKNMFISLAQDEEDHARVLAEQIARLEKNMSWCSYKERESEIRELRPNLQPVEARKKSTKGMDELDALRVAIAQEKAAIDLYKRQARELKDARARDMYAKLAEMEESHYDLIQAQIDYIEGTGYWFGVPEFSLERA